MRLLRLILVGLPLGLCRRSRQPTAVADSLGTGGFRSMVALDRTTGRGAVVLVSAALSAERVTDAGFALLKALRLE